MNNMVYEGFQTTPSNLFDDNISTFLSSKSQEFSSHMRDVARLSGALEGKKNRGENYSQEVSALQETLNKNVYPIIATLTALKGKYNTHAQVSRDNFNENNVLWSSTDEMQTTNQKIDEEQQKFNSLQQLSKQSLEQYRYQNNIMWMNIAFLVFLLGAVGYMYYWLNSMHSTSKSLTNMPNNVEDIVDNRFMHDDEHDDEHDDTPLHDDDHHDEHALFGENDHHDNNAEQTPPSAKTTSETSYDAPVPVEESPVSNDSQSSSASAVEDSKSNVHRNSMSSAFDDSVFDD